MTEKEMAEKNLILKFRTGSHLYGTSTENSDEDFVGVFIPDEEYVLGLKNIKEVDAGIKSKDEDGKNTSDAIDCKYYEFRNFLKLALENNPNIIELFFTNSENIIYWSEKATLLLGLPDLFLHKGLYFKFMGYANSQRHKMQIRTENFWELENAESILSGLPSKDLLMQWIGGMDDNPFIKYRSEHHDIKIGDLTLTQSVNVKKALEIVRDRLSKVTNRKELMTKYGYDTKFASHLIRLLFEGIELLENQRINFPLMSAPILLDIKNGSWEMPRVIELANSLEDRMRKAYEETSLPEINFDKVEQINKLCVLILKNFYCFSSYCAPVA